MANLFTNILAASCLLTGLVSADVENALSSARTEAISELSTELGLDDITEVSDSTDIG